MRTSALLDAKNCGFFEINGVSARTRGVNFSRFCADVLYGRAPNADNPFLYFTFSSYFSHIGFSKACLANLHAHKRNGHFGKAGFSGQSELSESFENRSNGWEKTHPKGQFYFGHKNRVIVFLIT